MTCNKPVIVLALIAPSLGSCGGAKDVEAYARKLHDLITAYQSQIEAKIKTEERSYRELADVQVKAWREATANSLEREPVERTMRLMDEIVDTPNRRVTRSRILSELRSYAEFDFEQTRKLLMDESETSRKAVRNLADLHLATKNVEALGETLASIASPRSFLKTIRSLSDYGCEVDRQYQLLDKQDDIERLATDAAGASGSEAAKIAKQLKEAKSQKESLDKRACEAAPAGKSHE